MRRVLFHGSVNQIKAPQFGLGKRHNDYGLGFYCTESEDLAKEWAVAREHDGWANRYEIDESDLTILNLNGGEYCILHWLTVLLENRQFETEYGLPSEAKDYLGKNFPVPYATSDVVIGYRADDSYFSFAQDFISGTISLQLSQLSWTICGLGRTSPSTFSLGVPRPPERSPRRHGFIGYHKRLPKVKRRF